MRAKNKLSRYILYLASLAVSQNLYGAHLRKLSLHVCRENAAVPRLSYIRRLIAFMSLIYLRRNNNK